MTKLEQAARQALGALEVATTPLAQDRQEVLRAITTLREALSGGQALSAAPGDREQAAQRLRELAGVSENDVADPLHPRYIEGYKTGHAAGRKRAAPQQEAQEPCPTCAALARAVMLDQVSFDRKPDCYGIRQITDDESVEEWEDIRTSPDVAREEANDMMATGRGEIYEVVPLWTTPQLAPQPAPDCHHRPPCDECAAIAAQGGK